ncbi:hypothetical protein RchiOBHm_Chr2g0102451 [Rosa chinensis]|uniref:Uncharacterized protein n=1 Tax=Rosa chinensis TaxID=74649 RepID=A0A2P6RMM1_ROSCH|nr:hypothetical protein RchiOBHm_Chr2g0102451 [Rosa chinensis]
MWWLGGESEYELWGSNGLGVQHIRSGRFGVSVSQKKKEKEIETRPAAQLPRWTSRRPPKSIPPRSSI